MSRTAEAVGRKTHLCAGCGGTFSYWMRRTSAAESDSDADVAAAQREAEAALAHDVDPHPCPHCGVVQPEMLATRQGKWFVASLLVGAVGIALGMFLAGGRLLTMQQGAWLAFLSSLAAWWIAMRGASLRPNDDLDANLALARKEMGVAKLFQGEPGDPAAEFAPEVLRPRPMEYPWGVGLCLAAAAAASAPTFAPLALGWTLNPGLLPTAVGPGDHVAVPFPDSTPWGARAVRSSARGTIANAAAVGLGGNEVLTATVYGSLENPQRETGRWELLDWARTFGVEFDLPRDPALAGKTLELDLVVEAVVRRSDGTEAVERFVHTPDLVLSAPSAGWHYSRSFYAGLIAALALSGLGSGLLLASAWGLKKSAAARSRLAEPGEAIPVFAPTPVSPVSHASPDDPNSPADDDRE